jgi:tryptophan-rich sensory protein
MKFNWFKFIVSISLPLFVGGLSGFFTANEIDGWYATLIQPSFNPPNWLFAPVWTTLYITMGISFYIMWTLPKMRGRKQAYQIYFVQLILNFFWSILFFSAHQIGWAFVDILLMLLTISVMINYFRKFSPIAAYINIPYLLWVTFATILNGAYLSLNGW